MVGTLKTRNSNDSQMSPQSHQSRSHQASSVSSDSLDHCSRSALHTDVHGRTRAARGSPTCTPCINAVPLLSRSCTRNVFARGTIIGTVGKWPTNNKPFCRFRFACTYPMVWHHSTAWPVSPHDQAVEWQQRLRNRYCHSTACSWQACTVQH
jgi:hypothetical protein